MPNLRDSEIARDMRAWIRKRYPDYSHYTKEAIFRGAIFAITGQFLPHINGNWTELELDLYRYFRIKGEPGSFTSRETRIVIGEYFSLHPLPIPPEEE